MASKINAFARISMRTETAEAIINAVQRGDLAKVYRISRYIEDGWDYYWTYYDAPRWLAVRYDGQSH